MAIAAPKVVVYQEFIDNANSAESPPYACIVGPNVDLHRFTDVDEKPEISLGAYDFDEDAAYDWPARSAGGKVVTSSVKLFVDNAELQYFSDLIGAGSVIAAIAGRTDRIRSDSLAFRTANDVERSALLYERDVKAGDIVRIRGVYGGESYSLKTYVRGFAYEAVASIVGTPTEDTANAPDQDFSLEVSQLAGAENCITLQVNGHGYDGQASGDVNETYTLEVTTGSVDGDLTTARLRVISASGNDSANSVVPGADGQFFAVGTRGLVARFDSIASTVCEDAAEEAGVTPYDLIVGQKFLIEISQAFESARMDVAGTYTGLVDDTYKIEVVEGGRFDEVSTPKVRVTTIRGLDFGGPTIVPMDDSFITIGTKGLRARFYGSGGSEVIVDDSVIHDRVAGLRKGDVFYVAVTAAASGRASTLILGHALSAQLQAATDLDLTLSIPREALEISQDRISSPPLTNFDLSETQITVNANIEAYDASWTISGVVAPLPLTYGDLYVEYHEYLQIVCNQLNVAVGEAGLLAIPGPQDPANPLKEGVAIAQANALGVPVKYIGVCDPDSLESWTEALAVIVGKDVFGIAPMSDNPEVHALVNTHVLSQSGPLVGAERRSWAPLQVEPEYRLIGTDTIDIDALLDSSAISGDDEILATITDDPDSTGTQYRLLTITQGDVDLTAAVRAGDEVRFLFSTDGFEISYATFIVDDVINSNILRLTSSNPTAVTTPQKVEIWRTRTLTDIATEAAAAAQRYQHKQISALRPGRPTRGGVLVPSFYYAAATAGRRSGIEPHRSQTNLPLFGFESVSDEYAFRDADIEIMRNGGVWVIIEDTDGTIITHMGLTTDVTGVLVKEESVVTNANLMAKETRAVLKPFIGQSNNVPTARGLMKLALEGLMAKWLDDRGNDMLGGRLVAGADNRVLSVEQHALLKDRVVVKQRLSLPAPVNNIDDYQTIT